MMCWFVSVVYSVILSHESLNLRNCFSLSSRSPGRTASEGTKHAVDFFYLEDKSTSFLLEM